MIKNPIQAGDGDPRHGTANGYQNHRCRCQPCTAAWREYHLAKLHRLGYHEPREAYNDRRALLADLADNHGTETRYRAGCRCEACRTASVQERRFRRERNRDAENAYQREYKREWRRRRKAESA